MTKVFFALILSFSAIQSAFHQLDHILESSHNNECYYCKKTDNPTALINFDFNLPVSEIKAISMIPLCEENFSNCVTFIFTCRGPPRIFV